MKIAKNILVLFLTLSPIAFGQTTTHEDKTSFFMPHKDLKPENYKSLFEEMKEDQKQYQEDNKGPGSDDFTIKRSSDPI